MPINTANTATGVILNTFGTHIHIKSFGALITVFLSQIVHGNELPIFLMFLLYFIDFVIGLILAFKLREFELSKFFKGSSKILIYGIFLVIGLSLDTTLHTGTFFMGTIFAFVIITDSISILRKLHSMGYNTPVFIEKYLISYKKDLENGRFMKK